MIRRSDRPLRIVRVSFETTRFSAQHLVDAYSRLVPVMRRTRLAPTRGKVGPAPKAATKRRRSDA